MLVRANKYRTIFQAVIESILPVLIGCALYHAYEGDSGIEITLPLLISFSGLVFGNLLHRNADIEFIENFIIGGSYIPFNSINKYGVDLLTAKIVSGSALTCFFDEFLCPAVIIEDKRGHRVKIYKRCFSRGQLKIMNDMLSKYLQQNNGKIL